ncbi:DUF2066 domain-containing protein [Spongiibacter sp. KMU-158]|uniref:DUF2066 domain-containing protein n=1 Tax=Spongiibacter pelagi TaxID=2760804 RepID=A0A927GV81_9GAMM|nr:DUF2066 domain-containing protein [Spongiibacter pelagi]MBD2858391.1 DUF2066 domain-containing protein [Spongiibacter pelagi]
MKKKPLAGLLKKPLADLFILPLIALLAACLVSAPVSADVVQKLYDAALPLESGRAELSQVQIREGLRQVFVRVSGESELDVEPGIAEALADPKPFLSQYNFRRQRDELGQERVILDMSFSPRQVNGTLQSAGLPVWSSNRPAVLVWMVIDTAQGRQFLNAENSDMALQALREEAYRRGLALQFPLLDLEDRGALSVDALWSMSVNQVRTASERYRAPYVLMGKATALSSGSWLASWAVLEAEQSQRLDTQGMGINQVLAPVIDFIADSQADQYALTGTGQDAQANLIAVKGVADFATYAEILTYLEGLAVVEHANLVWADGEDMVLELVLKDSLDKAQRFLSLDGRMQPLLGVTSGVDVKSGLMLQARYRWRGQGR